MSQLPATPLRALPRDLDVEVDRLADCVRRLDPGTRALLDLSVRRRLRDDAMAPLLGTDPFHLAWRRARALERVASDLGGDDPIPLAEVRAALETLPREAWDPLRTPALPAPDAAGVGAAATGDPEAPLVDAEAVPDTGTELVPAPLSAELAAGARVGIVERLDAFAAGAPTLRHAFGDLGRAFAGKVVRLVARRRRGGQGAARA